MSSAMETSKSRFRFTEEFDIHLAREVYGLNPYEDPNRWSTIQVNMIQITGKCVSIRTRRERIQNLVKKYLAKTGELEGKSGIEIIVTELDDLLQQISDLMSEYQGKRKILTAHHAAGSKSSYMKGYDAREQSCASLVEKDAAATQTNTFQVEAEVHQDVPEHSEEVVLEWTENQSASEMLNVVEVDEEMEKEKISLPPKVGTQQQTPSQKRPMAQANILTPLRRRRRDATKHSAMEYLEKKNQQQYDIKLKELAMQERRQLLEEKKFEPDRLERIKRLEMEEKRLQMKEKKIKIQLELFSNQQELIKLILKKDNNL